MSRPSLPRIGVQILAHNAAAMLDDIKRAEEAGIDTAWMTLPVVQRDPVAVFAAAAVSTSRIRLGTSIIPIYPRHPVALAQAALAVAELAPGRFRLGVGPSHRPMMEGSLGIPLRKPLTYLGEYLDLLKALLQRGGHVEYAGDCFRVNVTWTDPVDVEILASGLRAKSYRLIGAKADGGISWVTPLEHIKNVAIPALAEGAAQAGRPRPKMIMHLGVAAHDDPEAVRSAGRKQFGRYVTLPFYQRMFAQAGFPAAAAGDLTDDLLDAIVVCGDKESIAARLHEIARAGIDEVICSIVEAGPDPELTKARTLAILGELAQQT